jgi:hypothetical protein
MIITYTCPRVLLSPPTAAVAQDGFWPVSVAHLYMRFGDIVSLVLCLACCLRTPSERAKANSQIGSLVQRCPLGSSDSVERSRSETAWHVLRTLNGLLVGAEPGRSIAGGPIRRSSLRQMIGPTRAPEGQTAGPRS